MSAASYEYSDAFLRAMKYAIQDAKITITADLPKYKALIKLYHPFIFKYKNILIEESQGVASGDALRSYLRSYDFIKFIRDLVAHTKNEVLAHAIAEDQDIHVRFYADHLPLRINEIVDLPTIEEIEEQLKKENPTYNYVGGRRRRRSTRRTNKRTNRRHKSRS